MAIWEGQEKEPRKCNILESVPDPGPVPGQAPIAGNYFFVKIASKVVSFRILKEIFVDLTFWP